MVRLRSIRVAFFIGMIFVLPLTASAVKLGKNSSSIGRFAFTEKQSDPVYECSAEIDSVFMNMQNIVKEANDCWSKKKTRETHPNVSDKDLFYSEVEVCNCLKKSPIKDISDGMKDVNTVMKGDALKLPGIRENKNVLNDIELNGKKVRNRLENMKQGMLYQANLLFKEEPTITGKYNANFLTSGFDKEGMAGKILNDKTNKLTATVNAAEPSTSMFSTMKSEDAMKKALSNMKLSEGIDETLLKDRPFEPGQCIGGREYLLMNQFPESSIFYQDLLDETSYDESKWDFNVLKERLLTLVNGPGPIEANSKEINSIKERMKFLNRNPLIKNLFAATDKIDNYLQDSDSSDEAKKAIKKASSQLKEHKTRLFNILKKGINVNDTSCIAQGSCREKFLLDAKWNRLKDLHDDLHDFYKEPTVSLLVNTQAEKGMVDETKRFVSDPLAPYLQDLPKNPNDLGSSLSKYFDSEFTHPSSCSNTFSETKKCVETYALFCRQVPIAISQMKSPDGLDDLSFLNEMYFDTDYNKNEDFKRMNKLICDGRRLPKDGSMKAMSFNEYLKDSCSKNKSSQACTKNPKNEDIVAMRAKYDDLYKPSENETVKAFYTAMKANPVTEANDRAISEIKNQRGRPFEMARSLQSTLESMGDPIASSKTNVMNSSSSSSEVTNNSYSPESTFQQANSNYASTPVSQSQAFSSDVRKIDELKDDEKSEVLKDWKNEYEAAKKNSSGSAVSNSNEAALKARIEALEALLSQQKKISEDQYKLLNDALAKKEADKAREESVASQGSDDSQESSSKVHSATGATAFSEAVNGVQGSTAAVNRSMASVQGSAFNPASTESLASISNAAYKARKDAASNADSVAREEAKLVNLRRGAEGITIEAVANGQGANAITVPVSDADYKILISSPDALNLGQIEKTIPKDKLSQLEKASSTITLVLKNGQNPPFEVLVEKKDNKLVYKLKDNNGNSIVPVKRIYTRQALQLQLQAQ